MNEVKTFRAATMQEALDLIREEMGGEAVILHTRQVSRRRMLPWKKQEEEVEVTAGLGLNIRQQVPRRQREQKVTGTKKKAAQYSSARSNTAGVQTMRKNSPEPSGANHRFEQTSSDGDTVSFSPESTTQPSQQEEKRPRITSAAKRPASPQKPAPRIAASISAGEFSSKLDSIQKMLVNLGRTGPQTQADEIPGELFNLYTELIDAEVEEDLTRELIFRLKQNASQEQLNNHDTARALLTGMVESEIQCTQPITCVPGKRKVVALVGATGVGKTTTIAKLAANFRLRDGIKMGLVTVDTYRIAAVEQLRTYAEIIDLPMKVVTNPLEMRRALDELVGLDLVLIDTAGRSPRDDLKIQELKRLLAAADVDEVHLVLSMTSSLRTLIATAEKFSVANTTSLIMTKLDEAASMGTLLSVARKLALPFSYLTTGQDVPDDIESAEATRIGRLILGEDRLFD